MSHTSLLITGIARNCARTLRADVRRISAAFIAHKISWYIVESDSTDKTVSILHDLKNSIPSFDFSSLGNLSSHYQQRTQRLAFCRNIYLHYVSTNPICSHVQYVVVVDLDGVNCRLNSTSVQSCWLVDGWDVCCANQAGPYYDIWALRHPLLSPNDCIEHLKMLKKLHVGHFQSIFTSVHSRMIRIPLDHNWIEVESAFGGLAIYRRSVLNGVYYAGSLPSGEAVSEHVPFNRQIRDAGGKIFINPALINASIVEHSRIATPFFMALFWLYCASVDIAKCLGLISSRSTATHFLRN